MTREVDYTVVDDVLALRANLGALLVRVPLERPRVGREPEIVMREVWIPQASISEDSDVKEPGDEGALIVPEWVVRDRGLA